MGETMIDSDVRKFAEYLGCDPKLAQDLYFAVGSERVSSQAETGVTK